MNPSSPPSGSLGAGSDNHGIIFLYVCLPGFVLAACSPLTTPSPVPSPVITSIPGHVAATSTDIPVPSPTQTTSPTPANIPDLSGQTILLPALCDRSGPLAGSNAGRIQALEDVAGAINVQGGIFDAQLDLEIVDTKGDTEEAQTAQARVIGELGEGPIEIICDPQTEAAVRDMLSENEIPALGPADFAARGDIIFGIDATPQEHLGSFINDLVAHWGERKPEGAGGEIRLALISWPPEASGALTSEEFLADIQELNLEIVFQDELPADPDANIFDPIYQMRDVNANVIFTNMGGAGLAELLNALQSLGLRDRFVVGAPASSYDSALFEYLADPASANGLYLTSGWSWWSDENPGIQFLEGLGGDEEFHDWGYVEMAGAVALAQKALQDAILADGFQALSPEAVTSALKGLEDYPVMSGLYIVDYSGDRRSLEDLSIWVVGEDGLILEE